VHVLRLTASPQVFDAVVCLDSVDVIHDLGPRAVVHEPDKPVVCVQRSGNSGAQVARFIDRAGVFTDHGPGVGGHFPQQPAVGLVLKKGMKKFLCKHGAIIA
jgi:rhodanese-related sulfurtransferase